MKIIITTDKPTTFCGVISGIIPRFKPMYNVAGTKTIPPPSPTNEPIRPANNAMMTNKINSIIVPLQTCLIV
ncbi:hypothetical protein D3C79_956650 [compost metagenome]